MAQKTSRRKPTKAQQHAAIRAARGSLRPKPGEPPFAERWAEHKAEERALEERREELLAERFDLEAVNRRLQPVQKAYRLGLESNG